MKKRMIKDIAIASSSVAGVALASALGVASALTHNNGNKTQINAIGKNDNSNGINMNAVYWPSNNDKRNVGVVAEVSRVFDQNFGSQTYWENFFKWAYPKNGKDGYEDLGATSFMKKYASDSNRNILVSKLNEYLLLDWLKVNNVTPAEYWDWKDYEKNKWSAMDAYASLRGLNLNVFADMDLIDDNGGHHKTRVYRLMVDDINFYSLTGAKNENIEPSAKNISISPSASVATADYLTFNKAFQGDTRRAFVWGRSDAEVLRDAFNDQKDTKDIVHLKHTDAQGFWMTDRARGTNNLIYPDPIPYHEDVRELALGTDASNPLIQAFANSDLARIESFTFDDMTAVQKAHEGDAPYEAAMTIKVAFGRPISGNVYYAGRTLTDPSLTATKKINVKLYYNDKQKAYDALTKHISSTAPFKVESNGWNAKLKFTDPAQTADILWNAKSAFYLSYTTASNPSATDPSYKKLIDLSKFNSSADLAAALSNGIALPVGSSSLHLRMDKVTEQENPNVPHYLYSDFANKISPEIKSTITNPAVDASALIDELKSSFALTGKSNDVTVPELDANKYPNLKVEFQIASDATGAWRDATQATEFYKSYYGIYDEPTDAFYYTAFKYRITGLNNAEVYNSKNPSAPAVSSLEGDGMFDTSKLLKVVERTLPQASEWKFIPGIDSQKNFMIFEPSAIPAGTTPTMQTNPVGTAPDRTKYIYKLHYANDPINGSKANTDFSNGTTTELDIRELIDAVLNNNMYDQNSNKWKLTAFQLQLLQKILVTTWKLWVPLELTDEQTFELLRQQTLPNLFLIHRLIQQIKFKLIQQLTQMEHMILLLMIQQSQLDKMELSMNMHLTQTQEECLQILLGTQKQT